MSKIKKSGSRLTAEDRTRLILMMGFLTAVRNTGVVKSKEDFDLFVLKPLQEITGKRIPDGWLK